MGKDHPVNAGHTRDVGLIPVSGRSPGVWNGSPLQYSCLKNYKDRGVWRSTVHEVTKNWKVCSWTRKHRATIKVGTGIIKAICLRGIPVQTSFPCRSAVLNQGEFCPRGGWVERATGWRQFWLSHLSGYCYCHLVVRSQRCCKTT